VRLSGTFAKALIVSAVLAGCVKSDERNAPPPRPEWVGGMGDEERGRLDSRTGKWSCRGKRASSAVRFCGSPVGAEPDTSSFAINVRIAGENDFVAVPVPAPLMGEDYLASFGEVPCESTIEYYFSAQTTNGIDVTDPPLAPFEFYTAIVADNEDVEFADNAETDMGWTVGAPSDTATTGVWVRIDPIGTDAQPEDDSSKDGTLAWITGQGTAGGITGENDVDDGATTLTSPRLDALAEQGIAFVSYARWYSNDQGSAARQDTFFIEISNDDGESWETIEALNQNPNAWVRKSFRIDDYVVPTSEIRMRFIASDRGSGSIVEAGVDDVSLSFFNCESSLCAGDCDASGTVDFNDLVSMLFVFGTNSAACDADGSGTVDFNDLVSALFVFGPCE